jgi:hypothetical protein
MATVHADRICDSIELRWCISSLEAKNLNGACLLPGFKNDNALNDGYVRSRNRIEPRNVDIRTIQPDET